MKGNKAMNIILPCIQAYHVRVDVGINCAINTSTAIPFAVSKIIVFIYSITSLISPLKFALLFLEDTPSDKFLRCIVAA